MKILLSTSLVSVGTGSIVHGTVGTDGTLGLLGTLLLPPHHHANVTHPLVLHIVVVHPVLQVHVVGVGCTITILLTIFPVFPAVSVYVYSNTYIPGTLVFTLPLVAVNINPVPSTKSSQLAPGSLNPIHWLIVITPLPINVTTGGVVSILNAAEEIA